MHIAFFRSILVAALAAASVAAAAAEDIVLGQTTAPNNPVVASLAREYNAGLRLAIARANAAGGVRGRKIRLVQRDDNFDAKLTPALVTELVEQENALALVGVMGTQPVLKLAEQKVLENYKLASFGPVTGFQAALAAPNVFPVRGSYEEEVKAMLAHSARLGRAKVLYLYYEAGVGPHLGKLVPAMAQGAGVTLTGVAGFRVVPEAAAQQAEVRKTLDAQAVRPDSVILLAVGPVHSEAVKVLRAHYGRGMPIYSLGQVNAQNLVRDVGHDQARGVMLSQVVPMPGGTQPAIVREFAQDRARLGPDVPSTYTSLEGYLCGRIVLEVLKRAKTLTREGVLLAAENSGVIDVGGFRVDYGGELRRSINPIELTMLSRSGQLIR
jgi:ABC-type branched-subunit amino acid transport system substrate-binding protein